MTKKGIKMNISKCLKGYDIEKSESLTTEIRGKHKHTEGYKFLEKEELLSIVWFDEKLDNETKLKHLSLMVEILNKHGFGDYLKLEKDSMEIMVNENGFEKDEEKEEGESV